MNGWVVGWLGVGWLGVGWLGVWASGWFVWVVVFVLVLNGWLVGCVGDGRLVLNENNIKSHKLKLLSGLCIVVLCYYIVIVCCVLVGMICLCGVLYNITLIS